MSEFQISLIVVGLVAVAAIYAYNWMERRKYRKRFGAAFGQSREDVLERPEPVVTETVIVEQELEVNHHVQIERGASADGICALLSEATDYIATLTFNTSEGVDDLALLWQKRFDFGKNVHVCGLNATSGEWERVIAESHLFYAAFKLCLQLVDRSGPVSEVRLSDFRDTVRDIATHMRAEAVLPDVAEAARQAEAMDAFCAGVDQMIGLNIMPGGERVFTGPEVSRVCEHRNLVLQADGAFHLLDEHGHTLFSLSNLENVPFHHHTLGQMRVSGLTLLLDVPRVENPAERFDEMAVLARQLAMDLKAAVVDDRRVALGEAGFSQVRAQVADIELRMLEGGIEPGSAQARRLFS